MVLINFIKDAIWFVLEVLRDDGLYLFLGTGLAVALKVHINFDKLKLFIDKKSGTSIFTSVTFGAFTPFCACGTMALVLPMLATSLPWGPIMAFLTSSALMCPSTFVFYTGILGIQFAIAATLTSLFIGISSGYITILLEKKTHLLKDQLRIIDENYCGSVCCSSYNVLEYYSLDDNSPSIFEKLKLRELSKEFYNIGIKIILPYFCLFAFLGFLVERLIPSKWIITILGSGHIYSVPLLALIGLPLYVGSASALPLIQTLLKSGASQGALLAFLITGPGTSIAVMSGLSILMKRQAIGIYIFFIFIGAIFSGYVYDIYLFLKRF